jgi:hypothetical protein
MIKLKLEIELVDGNGRVVKRHRQTARSLLNNFISMLKGYFACRYCTDIGHGNVTVTAEDGTVTSYPNQSSTVSKYTCTMKWNANGDVGDVSQGIIVGSSDAANSLTTYKLGAKIGHGSGSGQLYYNPMYIGSVTNPSGGILEFVISRTFSNLSPATITVKEVGILVKEIDATGGYKIFLIARDVLSTPMDVPPGYALTVRYKFSITVA